MRPQKTVIETLFELIEARLTCIEFKNFAWVENHELKISQIGYNYLPNGSGFQHGTIVSLGSSNKNKMVLFSCYCFINSDGTNKQVDIVVTVTPSSPGSFHIEMEIDNKKSSSYSGILYDSFKTSLFTLIKE